MAAESTGDVQEHKTHEYGRPMSIEDASNRFLIHPLSDVVVKFGIKFGLSPNLVSLLGLGCGILAAFLYYELPNTSYVVGAFAAMLGWHILDGADGRLARATGNTSAFGRIIDGICDHLVFGAVYIALALQMIASGAPTSIWWLVIAAGVAHGIQAAGYEERRQKYQRRLEGICREDVEETLLKIDGKKSLLASVYDAAQKLVAGGDYGFDGKLAALRTTEEGKEEACALVHRTVPMVKIWGLLNANNRTFLIFAVALFGRPELFFLFELVVLSAIMAVLMVAEWQVEKTLSVTSQVTEPA